MACRDEEFTFGGLPFACATGVVLRRTRRIKIFDPSRLTEREPPPPQVELTGVEVLGRLCRRPAQALLAVESIDLG